MNLNISIIRSFVNGNTTHKVLPKNRRLALESLESRELLSVAPDFLFSFWGAINANTNKQDFDFGSYSSSPFDSSIANTYGEVNVNGSVTANNNQLAFQSQVTVEKSYSDIDFRTMMAGGIYESTGQISIWVRADYDTQYVLEIDVNGTVSKSGDYLESCGISACGLTASLSSPNLVYSHSIDSSTTSTNYGTTNLYETQYICIWYSNISVTVGTYKGGVAVGQDKFTFNGNASLDIAVNITSSGIQPPVDPPKPPVVDPPEQTAPKNYAVLFSGGGDTTLNSSIYGEQLEELYQTLQKTYGLSKENIYVLYADKNDGITDDWTFPENPNFDMATLDALQKALKQVGDKMESDDHLLFFTSDHGGKDEKKEYIIPWKAASVSISDTDVARCLSQIKQGWVTAVFTQCYSGGILEDVGAEFVKNNDDVHFYGMASVSKTETVGQPFGSSQFGFTDNFLAAIKNGVLDVRAIYNQSENYPLANVGEKHPSYFSNYYWNYGGEDFLMFNTKVGNRSVNPPGSNTSTLLSNSPTGTKDAFELLTTDPVYLTYAVGNYGYEDSGVYAKYSWTDTPETLAAIRQNEVLEKTVSLGQLAAGTHTVSIELYDSVTDELVDTITRTFTVKTASSDPGDTLAAAKPVIFTDDGFTFTETIGNGSQAEKDVDIYSLTIAAGDVGKTFLINSSPTDDRARYSVWSVLRLFNSSGTEIAHSEASDLFGIGDAFFVLTPTAAGTYYIGVSAHNNTAYSATTAGSGTADGAAGSTGDYQISVRRITDPKLDLSLFYQVSWYNPIISLTSQTSSLPGNTFTLDDELVINFSFANLGEVTATDITSRVTITGTNGYTFTQDFVTDTLAIGNVYALPKNVNLGKLAAGTYTVSVELNIGNKDELTRDNNTYQTAFEVKEETTTDPPTETTPKPVTAGKPDGTGQTSAATITFDVIADNRIENKTRAAKTTGSKYTVKVYAWDAKKNAFSTKAKTITITSTAANTEDGKIT